MYTKATYENLIEGVAMVWIASENLTTKLDNTYRSYSIELRVCEPLVPRDPLSLFRLLLLGTGLLCENMKEGSKADTNSYDSQCSTLYSVLIL